MPSNLPGAEDQLPFGEDPLTGTGENEKHRFTTYERDSESGTDYAINRQHQFTNGRFMQPDPCNGRACATNPQTLTRYVYGWGDPVNKIDPDGLDSLLFDGCQLTRLTNDGKAVESWSAVSGRPNTTIEQQDQKRVGPLPEGQYTVDPKETQNRYDTGPYAVPSFGITGVQIMNYFLHPQWVLPSQGAIWGDKRTVLHPDPGTNLRGRDPDGFFIHGGDKPGSAGCIDLTGQNEAFHKYLKAYGMPLKVVVKLTCNPWTRSSNQQRSRGAGAIGNVILSHPFGWNVFDLLHMLFGPKQPDSAEHLA